MIDPSDKDIGARVVYQAPHSGAPAEDGIITSINDKYVFVRFGRDASGSKACRREDLRWSMFSAFFRGAK